MNQTLKILQQALKDGCEVTFRPSHIDKALIEVVVTRFVGDKSSSMLRVIEPGLAHAMLNSQVDVLADVINACYVNLQQYELTKRGDLDGTRQTNR